MGPENKLSTHLHQHRVIYTILLREMEGMYLRVGKIQVCRLWWLVGNLNETMTLDLGEDLELGVDGIRLLCRVPRAELGKVFWSLCIEITSTTSTPSSYVCVAFAVVVHFSVFVSLMFYMYMYVYSFPLKLATHLFFSKTHHFIFLDSQPLRIFLDDVCFFLPSFCINTRLFLKKSQKRPDFPL